MSTDLFASSLSMAPDSRGLRSRFNIVVMANHRAEGEVVRLAGSGNGRMITAIAPRGIHWRDSAHQRHTDCGWSCARTSDR